MGLLDGGATKVGSRPVLGKRGRRGLHLHLPRGRRTLSPGTRRIQSPDSPVPRPPDPDTRKEGPVEILAYRLLGNPLETWLLAFAAAVAAVGRWCSSTG